MAWEYPHDLVPEGNGGYCNPWNYPGSTQLSVVDNKEYAKDGINIIKRNIINNLNLYNLKDVSHPFFWDNNFLYIT